jgi:hypothetical protein
MQITKGLIHAGVDCMIKTMFKLLEKRRVPLKLTGPEAESDDF